MNKPGNGGGGGIEPFPETEPGIGGGLGGGGIIPVRK